MMKSGVLVLVLLACFEAEVVARGLSFGVGGSFPLEETSQVNSGATPTDAAAPTDAPTDAPTNAPTDAPTGPPVIVRGEKGKNCADSTDFSASNDNGAVAAGVLVDVTEGQCRASAGKNEHGSGEVAMIFAHMGSAGESFEWTATQEMDSSSDRTDRMHGCYIQIGLYGDSALYLIFNPSATTAITQHHQGVASQVPADRRYDYAICVHTEL